MNISAEDFRQHFRLLSDEALLATNREDLVDTAKAVYDEEIVHRGLAGDEPEEVVAEIEAPAEEEAAETMVSLGSFMDLDEARLARGLLQGAQIPSAIQNDATGTTLHLMVPASYEEAALQVLGGEISEEELAAQAEAAGNFEED